MTIWYRAENWSNNITEVDVSRATEMCVYIGGRKHLKNSTYEWYRRTREAARFMLIEFRRREVDNAWSRLEYAEEALREARKA